MIEYLTEHIDRVHNDYLNKLGKSGWQLITIYEDIAYFMRPMPAINIPASAEAIEWISN
jgi:hypothetical protein